MGRGCRLWLAALAGLLAAACGLYAPPSLSAAHEEHLREVNAHRIDAAGGDGDVGGNDEAAAEDSGDIGGGNDHVVAEDGGEPAVLEPSRRATPGEGTVAEPAGGSLLAAAGDEHQRSGEVAAASDDKDEKVKDEVAKDAEEAVADCSICHEPMCQTEVLMATKCNHCFHSKCLLEWAKKGKRDGDRWNPCPNCKGDTIKSSTFNIQLKERLQKFFSAVLEFLQGLPHEDLDKLEGGRAKVLDMVFAIKDALILVYAAPTSGLAIIARRYAHDLLEGTASAMKGLAGLNLEDFPGIAEGRDVLGPVLEPLGDGDLKQAQDMLTEQLLTDGTLRETLGNIVDTLVDVRFTKLEERRFLAVVQTCTTYRDIMDMDMLVANVGQSVNGILDLDAYKCLGRFQDLPESFGGEFRQVLRTFHVTGHKLQRLPESFGELQAVEYLNLRSNQLRELPHSFGNLFGSFKPEASQILYLDGNQLQNLPDNFANMKALKRLGLQHNQLHTLPDNFGNLEALEHLDLRNNQLHTLPESFTKLKALKILSLDRNEFQTNCAEVKRILSHLSTTLTSLTVDRWMDWDGCVPDALKPITKHGM